MLDKLGLTSAEKVQRAGGDLLDTGIVTIGSRPKDVLARAKALKAIQGEKIGGALEEAGAAGPFQWGGALEKARAIVGGLNAAERRQRVECSEEFR
jgi:hypothetical protein